MPKSNTTQTTKVEPWKPAQDGLKEAISGVEGLYGSGGFFTPGYDGQRVAGFGDTSQMGQNMLLDQAQQPGTVGTAQSTISQMMNPNYQSEQLNAVKQNALGSAIPAATSMFSGSGMLNSTMAMDSVGRAATEAIAPYEYGAYENAQGRALSAAGMAPTLDKASYLPGTITSTVGGAQDAMSQAFMDSDMAKYYENANPELQNLQGFSNMMMGLGGMGRTGTETQPGQSGLQSLATGGLTGIGTYGALAGAGVANPMLMPFSIGAGLLGMI